MLSSIMAAVVAVFVIHAQPQAIQQNVTLSVTQTECLTEAVYFESRGEGVSGGVAVSYVIQNRAVVDHKSFCQVIHEKGQFSFYKPGYPLVIREKDAWNNSAKIAVDTQLGFDKNPIGNATYYNTVSFYGVHHIVFVARVGHHFFYGPPDIIYQNPLISNANYQSYANIPTKSPTLHVQTKNQIGPILNKNRVGPKYESSRFKHRYIRIVNIIEKNQSRLTQNQRPKKPH